MAANDETTSSATGTVLVVDDDPHSLEILTRYLGREKFATVKAASGRECLEIARSRRVDVIVLDVMMPVLDGLEVAAELARDDRTRGIPVILLTARDDSDTRAKAMRLGVSEFLAKPVVRAELFSRVRSQVRVRARERELERTLAKKL